MARKARIGVSVFFGLLTVALTVLWCCQFTISRNYYSHTEIGIINSYAFVVHSSAPYAIEPGVVEKGWSFKAGRDRATRARFRWTTGVDGTTITIPLGFLICLSALAAIVPSLPQNFSLRTMLIVTTLLAVLLGLALWVWR